MATKQIGLDGHCVEPSHVQRRVDLKEHGGMVLVSHVGLSLGANPDTNGFGESITCHRFMELMDSVALIDLKSTK